MDDGAEIITPKPSTTFVLQAPEPSTTLVLQAPVRVRLINKSSGVLVIGSIKSLTIAKQTSIKPSLNPVI
ncbi:unnamed protein product [Rotaria socialis]